MLTSFNAYDGVHALSNSLIKLNIISNFLRFSGLHNSAKTIYRRASKYCSRAARKFINKNIGGNADIERIGLDRAGTKTSTMRYSQPTGTKCALGSFENTPGTGPKMSSALLDAQPGCEKHQKGRPIDDREKRSRARCADIPREFQVGRADHRMLRSLR